MIYYRIWLGPKLVHEGPSRDLAEAVFERLASMDGDELRLMRLEQLRLVRLELCMSEGRADTRAARIAAYITGVLRLYKRWGMVTSAGRRRRRPAPDLTPWTEDTVPGAHHRRALEFRRSLRLSPPPEADSIPPEERFSRMLGGYTCWGQRRRTRPSG
jgi:hypothetical protein